jgi:hypothetical protein
MTEFSIQDATETQTALQIGQALAYLVREAESAGLQDLASHIGTAEAAAYETARQEAYLQI